MMTTISYKLPDFEGPLDLLLFLVQKNKLNILDIPIHELVEQYVATIKQMEQQQLEVASSFLDMAARLLYIKSAMLLPRHEEAEQLKKELSGELIEYQLCQKAAGRLAAEHIGYDLFVRQPTPFLPDRTYRLHHDPAELLKAYFDAAGRGKRRLPPPARAFSGIVQRPVVSVYSRIIAVLRRVKRGGRMAYDGLFEGARSKSELVATFLAVLELVKSHRLLVEGEPGAEEVALLNGTHRPSAREEDVPLGH